MAVLFRTNGQSESFESALAERGIPYLVRGGERFFSRKEVRDAIVLMRGAARSDDGSVPLPDLARDVLLGAGWSRQPPTSGGAARERWESLSALASLADDLHALDPDARLPALVRELRSAPRPSTPPRSTASPWPRSTRPRAWSGTPSSSSAAPTACCPSRWPTPHRP